MQLKGKKLNLCITGCSVVIRVYISLSSRQKLLKLHNESVDVMMLMIFKFHSS